MTITLWTFLLILLLCFVCGHVVGYFRGRGRVACPLCDGKGTVEGKAPVISNEKDAFDAGFRLGLRAGAPGIKREDDRAKKGLKP